MAVAQDQMPWQPNLETAQRVAAETNRLVLVHFWAPWCRPCVRMEKDVFANPETAKGLEANFVVVKINADEAPATTRLYGVSSLPSDVIITPNGRLVSQMQSPPTSSQYVTQLNQAAAGHRSLAAKPQPPSVQQPAAPANAAPPVNSGAAYPPNPAAQAGAGLATSYQPPATQQAAANDRYAEYFTGQPGAAPPPGANPVMPAQAYGASPPAGPSPPAGDPYASPAAQAPAASPAVPAVDPYAAPPAAASPAAQPSAHDPYAAPASAMTQPPVQNPYAASPPAADPYAAPAAVHPPADPYAAPPSAQPPAAAPYAANPYAAQPPANQPPASQPPLSQPQGGAQAANLPQLPPGCPPLGLDGNCPVTLVEQKRWTLGAPAFGAVHRGRTYLFLGPQERDKFMADPDRYSPVMSGIDPVMAFENGAQVPGKREFGVFGADGRIYLFADEGSRARFEQNEQHYAARALQASGIGASYQAMRPNR
jgi:thiol-disulfide isomerase/thioredoxin